jgi:hypothetical protein
LQIYVQLFGFANLFLVFILGSKGKGGNRWHLPGIINYPGEG